MLALRDGERGKSAESLNQREDIERPALPWEQISSSAEDMIESIHCRLRQ